MKLLSREEMERNQRFETALAAWLGGVATERDVAELEALFRADPQAIRRYREQVSLCVDIGVYAASPVSRARSARRFWGRAAAVAAVLAILLAAGAFARRQKAGETAAAVAVARLPQAARAGNPVPTPAESRVARAEKSASRPEGSRAVCAESHAPSSLETEAVSSVTTKQGADEMNKSIAMRRAVLSGAEMLLGNFFNKIGMDGRTRQKALAGCVAGMAALLSAVSQGATISWYSTTGGDLLSPANWNGGVLPGTSDYAEIAKQQSAPITASGNLTAKWISKLSSVSGETVFDLGADNSFLAVERVFVTGHSTVRLTSGTMGIAGSSAANRFFLGVNTTEMIDGDNNFIVDGPAAKLKIFGNPSDWNASYLGIGQDFANNSVVVRNGGTLEGEVKMGFYRPWATNNTLLVTGPGSSFLNTNASMSQTIGLIGGQNSLIVSNSAKMFQAGSVVVGTFNTNQSFFGSADGNVVKVADGGEIIVKGSFSLGDYSSSNRLEVQAGGHLVASNLFRIGVQGTYGPRGNVLRVSGENARAEIYSELSIGSATGGENRVEVGNGGMLTLAGSVLRFASAGLSGSSGNVLFIEKGGVFCHTSQAAIYTDLGNSVSGASNQIIVEGIYSNDTANTSSTYYLGESSANNQLIVRNGGEFTTTNLSFWVGGNNANAAGNTVEIRNGGKMRLTSSVSDPRLQIGNLGTDNGLIVDGSTLEAPKYLIALGNNIAGVRAYGRFENGAVVNLRRIVLGDKPPSCFLTVSNSTVTLAEQLDLGYSTVSTTANPTNTWVFLGGTNAQIVAKANLRLRNGSTIAFGIPRQGFQTVPITCNGIDASPLKGTIRVTVDPHYLKGGTIPLINCTGADLPDLTNVTFDLPAGVKLVKTARQIAVHVPSRLGTVVKLM